MEKRVVFFNGEFVDESQARVSIYDSALMFGDMVFEMTRSFHRQHFRLTEHIERLFDGLKVLRIDPEISREELAEICYETTRLNEEFIPEGDEHRLMINISRGPLGIYSHLFEKQGPTIIVADFPLSWTISGLAHLIDTGINAVVPSQRNPGGTTRPKDKEPQPPLLPNGKHPGFAGSRRQQLGTTARS